MDQDEVKVHKNAKNERNQYPAIFTEQVWSIKDLLHGQKITTKKFSLAGTKRAIPSRQDRPMLPARPPNQNTGFASPCPLAEPAIL